MQINEKKSKVVSIKGDKKERSLNGGFRSMGDRMVYTNGVLDKVKYAAARSGSKHVVGKEGWKGMVVNKPMYQHECDDLKIQQNGMRR